VVVDLLIFAGLGYWGYHLASGPVRLALAVFMPAMCGVLWLTCGVPQDPLSDSRPIVPVSGTVRLLLEVVILGVAAFGIWTAGSRAGSETLLTAAGLCYGVTWERLVWLVRD
jgi:hypothetical protein